MGFEGHFLTSGDRGSAIFSVRKEEGYVFVLQFRAMKRSSDPPPTSGSALTLVTDIQIRFCPWCGVSLARHYKEQLDRLDRTDLSISMF